MKMRPGSERGQVLVLFALIAVLLVGAGGLALDLGYQSVGHRAIQNWADAAAIAGARDCTSGCNAKTEVQDSLQMVLQNSPWSATTSWATAAPTSGCSVTSCVVTGYSGPAGFTNFAVSVSSPPATPTNSAYNTNSYVEVDITQTNGTTLAGAMGVSSTQSGGHAVAFSSGPPGPYQYTFFSKKQADSGNQMQTVTGDAYVGDGYKPASQGHAGMCVLEVPGPEPASDSDGDAAGAQDSDVDDQGHVTYAAVPGSGFPEPTYAPAFTPPCPGSGGGQLFVQQTSPSSGANCPVNATPTLDSATGVWVCVQPNPTVPNIPPPATTGSLGCGATITSATPPGVYSVPAGCTVVVQMKGAAINCISLVLGAGASVDAQNKQGSGYMTSYGFNPAGDATATSAITSFGFPAPATACPGAGVSSNNSVIWAADPGSSGTTPVALTNGQHGCCSDSLFVGTIFLPNQAVSYTTNNSMEDAGSVYVGDWHVQSGNHPNPKVTRDASAAAGVTPSLRLVE